jgi:DNA invertase Pin-like site-specific DNA recombinase
MTYGYVRVSTDMQTNENQKYEINNFCNREGIRIESWFEETISGAKEVEKRELGKLLKNMQAGDTLICTELSRLGRSLFMIMEILNICTRKEIKLLTIKDRFKLCGDITAKALAFAFGLAAEIERDLISKRTKEALQRRKAEGWPNGKPGLPKGAPRKKRRLRLEGMENEIKALIKARTRTMDIAKMYNVNRDTVSKFMSFKCPELYEAKGESGRKGLKGIKYGKRLGSRILTGKERTIENMLREKLSFPKMASVLDTTRITVNRYVYEMHPEKFVQKGRNRYYNYDFPSQKSSQRSRLNQGGNSQ